MRFAYKALYEGQVKTGKIEAFSKVEVVEYLRNNKFFPIEITESKDIQISLGSIGGSITYDEIIHFTRQMSIMLNAGMTISTCIDILIQQATKAKLKDLYTEVQNNIKSGETFSTALAHFPQHFSRFYLALVKAGEASGKLNDILEKLAEDMDKQRAISGKLKSAMTYPAIILIGVIGVIVVMLVVIVPQLTSLYKDLNVPLPATTQLVIDISTSLTDTWYIYLGLLILGGFLVKRQLESEKGRYLVYSILMRIPIFGNLIKMGNLVATTRTFALLLGSGVLVLDSINIITGATVNPIFQQAFQNIYQDIQKGNTITQAMQKQKIFPPILVQMTAVGEQTGKLDTILFKVADYFESETDIAIKSAMSAIEPTIIIVMGIIVFFIIFTVVTPIFNLTSSIGDGAGQF